MTSTNVCHQGLQSCLEPLVRLKLNLNNNKDKIEPDMAGGWSCLQSLTNPTTQTTKNQNETEQVYVHPLSKRSASLLSPKSLEMCTESLGNETGSENGSDDFSFFAQRDADISLVSLESSEKKTNPTLNDNIVQATPKRLKHSGGCASFPPPLTSISGSNGVQVRPHREGGRLVLKAVAVTFPSPAYFEAERGDGRLRLRLVKDLNPDCDNEDVGEDDDGEECDVEDDQAVQVEVDEGEDGVKNQLEAAENVATEEMDGISGNVETEEMDGISGNVETEEMDGISGNVETGEMDGNTENVETGEMDGISGNVVGEKEMEKKLPRPISRCKEGGCGKKKMVMNWPESFWVAT